MAVRAAYVLVGMLAGVLIGAAVSVSRADEASAETVAVAEEAGVNVTDLEGAVNTTGLGAREYEVAVGELPPPPSPSPARVAAPTDSAWDRLAACESNGRWNAATGNGYYGGLQFDLPSWRAAGGSGLPSQASRAEQIRVGIVWQRLRGWSAWPVCSRILGLR